MATPPTTPPSPKTEDALVDNDSKHPKGLDLPSVPSPAADPASKRISKEIVSTKPHSIEPFQLEEGQPPQNLARFHFKSRGVWLAEEIMKYLVKLWSSIGAIFVAIAILIAILLLDIIFAIFAYYFGYAEIYFNSKIAYNIFRNNHTEGAFKFFFWLIATLACIPNAVIAYGIAWGGWKLGKAVKMPIFIRLFWMIPFCAAFLGIKSITFWIRPLLTDVYQTSIFNHGCATNGWDLDIVFASSDTNTLVETLPVVGTAIISSTRSGDSFTTTFTRHSDNHNRFDFTISTISGSINPPFTNITYDWQNNTYVAIGPNSTNVTGAYTTTPVLSFPSLNLSLLDDSIPFQRPNYKACWPAAATLVSRNSTSNYSIDVLKSLTLDPRNSARMKVCGMALSEAFQISLGVVFIDHYYYSLCVTKPGVQSPTGSNSDPESWDNGSD